MTGARDLTLASAGDALDRGLREDPRREALVAADVRLTYEQLDLTVDRAAAALHALGLGRGDVLAVSLPNGGDVVVTFYAALRLGAVWLGVNRNLAPPEKQYILHDAGASLLVAEPAVAGELDRAEVPLLSRVIEVGGPNDQWCGQLAERLAAYPRVRPSAHEAAGIAYTSGTTGRPKGVVHSHHNILLPGAALVAARGFGARLRKGDCAALTILNMQVTSTLLAAQAGGTQIVMDRVDPVGIAQWISREQVTAWFGVPTMLHGLALSPDVSVDDLASLTDAWTGGTFLSATVRNAFEQRFGIPIWATYGLTEAPTIVTMEAPHADRVDGSSGTALPHVTVDIRDDAGLVLPPGEVGEITVRATDGGDWAGAYRPMLEYLGHPAATEAAVRTGVLYTGDLGQLDSAGNLFVRDRRNAVILRGGSNVYPAEVERVLLSINGVVGATVIGTTDERLGERVAAAIELEPGSEIDAVALHAHCRARLARYKVPDQWRFGQLPRNAMGKVVRIEVERWFDDEHQSEEATTNQER